MYATDGINVLQTITASPEHAEMSVEVNIYIPSRRSRSALLPSSFTGTSARPHATAAPHGCCAASVSIVHLRGVSPFLVICCANFCFGLNTLGFRTRPKKEAFCPVQDVPLSSILPPPRRVATFHRRRISITPPLTESDCYQYLILNRFWGNNDSPLHLIVLPSISRQHR